MTQLKLNIKEMGCQACVGRVTKAIEKVPGARPLTVELGQATVEVDTQQTTAAAIIEAVGKAGYPASEVAS